MCRSVVTTVLDNLSGIQLTTHLITPIHRYTHLVTVLEMFLSFLRFLRIFTVMLLRMFSVVCGYLRTFLRLYTSDYGYYRLMTSAIKKY